MALPELVCNSPTPGQVVALGTLSAAFTSATVPAAGATFTVSAAPPAALVCPSATIGQFRVVIDSEIVIVNYFSGTWTVITRGAEGSTAAAHSIGASVMHDLTAGALTSLVAEATGTGVFGMHMSVSAQLGSGAAMAKVALNTIDYDLSGWCATANNRFQPQQAGYYHIDVGVGVTASLADGDTVAIQVYKNGASVTGGSGNSASQAGASTVAWINPCTSCVVYLNGSTDYVELWGQCLSSAGVQKTTVNFIGWMTGFLATATVVSTPNLLQGVNLAGVSFVQNKLLTTDAQPAFAIGGDGTLSWGPGGSTATDTTLKRAGVNQLQVGANAVVGGAWPLPMLSVVGIGNAIEFGHTSGPQYHGALGNNASGNGALVFSGTIGTTSTYFNSSTIKPSIIQSDLAGGFFFGTSLPNATNTAFVQTAQLDVSGNLTLSSGLYASYVQAQNAAQGTIQMVPNSGNNCIESMNGGNTTSQSMSLTGKATGNMAVLTLAATSTIYNGTIAASSDAALKQDIEPLTGALEAIGALKPRRFRWNDHECNHDRAGSEDYGLVAQEVEPVLPHLIREFDLGKDSEHHLKALRVVDIVPFLVGAVQELSAKIEALEAAHA